MALVCVGTLRHTTLLMSFEFLPETTAHSMDGAVLHLLPVGITRYQMCFPQLANRTYSVDCLTEGNAKVALPHTFS